MRQPSLHSVFEVLPFWIFFKLENFLILSKYLQFLFGSSTIASSAMLKLTLPL